MNKKRHYVDNEKFFEEIKKSTLRDEEVLVGVHAALVNAAP